MIFLILSIIFSSMIFLIFGWFKTFKLHTFPAIVINYLTAGVFGFFFIPSNINLLKIIDQPWIPFALIIGFSFISIFTLMAVTTQKLGASVASVSNKMAVVIPVIFAFILYNDNINVLKIIGIILALIGVYFSSKKNGSIEIKDKSSLILPMALFLSSGLLDSIIKYTEEHYLNTSADDILLFTPTIFIIAFIFGALFLLFQFLSQKKSLKINLKDVSGGLILGMINYGSIFFVLSALNEEGWESSVVFPINNMGVVILTSLSSLLIFNEKLKLVNRIGIFISVIAIALIAFSM